MKKYQIIYADPPWKFNNKKTDNMSKDNETSNNGKPMAYDALLCGGHKPHDLQGYKIGDKIKYYDLKSQLHIEKIKDFTKETGEWICLMSNNILLHPDRIEGYAT